MYVNVSELRGAKGLTDSRPMLERLSTLALAGSFTAVVAIRVYIKSLGGVYSTSA
jgi:hypothetical protein